MVPLKKPPDHAASGGSSKGIFLGKHLARAAARRKVQRRRRTLRLTVGAGAAVVAVSAFGFTPSGAAPGSPQGVPVRVASDGGAAVVQAATPGAQAVPAAGPLVAEPAAAVVVSAPAEAMLSYSRPDIRTVAKPQPKKLSVVSAQPQRPAKGSLLAPLKMLNPSSPYGPRTSPITGKPGEFHWGEDFAAGCGTDVFSADAGVVLAAGWDKGGGGNRVELDHGNGLVTTYNHLESIDVRKGQSVQPGEVIAKVGTTGSSTGCHLHFETVQDGRHADPAKWTLLPARPLVAAAG